ncbi:unnamed protein product [Mortierella alpina]
MAQELLLTFGNTIGELALIPGKSAIFIVRVNGVSVFDRKDHGRFPEMKEVKQLVRTVIAPDMGLGHSDTAVKSAEVGKTNSDAATKSEPATSSVTTHLPETSAAPSSAAVDDDAEDSTVHDKECKTCL